MGHGHDHGHAAGRAGDRSRLKLVLLVTSVVLVVELVGAWVAGSLALLADAGPHGDRRRSRRARARGVVRRGDVARAALDVRLPPGGGAGRPGQRAGAAGAVRLPRLGRPEPAGRPAGRQGGAADPVRDRRPARQRRLADDPQPFRHGLAEPARRHHRGVRRPARLAARDRGRCGHPDHRLAACGPGRLAGDRGADPAAGAAAAQGRGGVLLEIAPAGPRPGRRPRPPARDARGRRRPRPARLDDHQRAAQPLRARHRHRRGAGRATASAACSTGCPPAPPSTSRSGTRPSRSSPSRTASTRTSARRTSGERRRPRRAQGEKRPRPTRAGRRAGSRAPGTWPPGC